jgi:hypothetical protein
MIPLFIPSAPLARISCSASHRSRPPRRYNLAFRPTVVAPPWHLLREFFERVYFRGLFERVHFVRGFGVDVQEASHETAGLPAYVALVTIEKTKLYVGSVLKNRRGTVPSSHHYLQAARSESPLDELQETLHGLSYFDYFAHLLFAYLR